MGRPPLWTAIRDTLLKEIAQGHYAPGARLPTEAHLSERFGVNRHTVRRALAQLAELLENLQLQINPGAGGGEDSEEMDEELRDALEDLAEGLGE